MNARIARVLLALTIATGAATSVAAPVVGATRIAVSPSFLRLSTSAGGSGSVTIAIHNTGDVPFTIAPTVEDYPDAAAGRSAAAWIVLDPAQALVKPGEEADVAVNLTVPADAGSGGWYAAVSITTGDPASDGSSTSISGRILVPVWIAVSGAEPITRLPVIERFAAVLEADGRLGYRALVHNDGNTHAFALATVSVGADGQPATATWDPVDHGILPAMTASFASGSSLPVWTTDPLVATLVLVPSESGEVDDFAPLTATTTFTADGGLAIDALAGCENLDRGPTLSADLGATGTIGIAPSVTLTVIDDQGREIDTVRPFAPPVAWPGIVETVSGDFPQRLGSGAYTLHVTATWGAATAAADLPFSIGGDPATALPLCSTAGS